jgi:hypothetical protein
LSALSQKVSFTVPAGAGSYAPETIDFSSQNAAVLSEQIERVTAVVAAAVATAVLELWFLDVASDPTNAGNYHLFGPIANGAAVGGATVEVADYRGVQIRAKSGGTAGSVVVSASAKLPVRNAW